MEHDVQVQETQVEERLAPAVLNYHGHWHNVYSSDFLQALVKQRSGEGFQQLCAALPQW